MAYPIAERKNDPSDPIGKLYQNQVTPESTIAASATTNPEAFGFSDLAPDVWVTGATTGPKIPFEYRGGAFRLWGVGDGESTNFFAKPAHPDPYHGVLDAKTIFSGVFTVNDDGKIDLGPGFATVVFDGDVLIWGNVRAEMPIGDPERNDISFNVGVAYSASEFTSNVMDFSGDIAAKIPTPHSKGIAVGLEAGAEFVDWTKNYGNTWAGAGWQVVARFNESGEFQGFYKGDKLFDPLSLLAGEDNEGDDLGVSLSEGDAYDIGLGGDTSGLDIAPPGEYYWQDPDTGEVYLTTVPNSESADPSFNTDANSSIDGMDSNTSDTGLDSDFAGSLDWDGSTGSEWPDTNIIIDLENGAGSSDTGLDTNFSGGLDWDGSTDSDTFDTSFSWDDSSSWWQSDYGFDGSGYDTTSDGLDTNFGGSLDWDGSTGSDTWWDSGSNSWWDTSWDYGDSGYDTTDDGLDTNFGGSLDWDGSTGSDTWWDSGSDSWWDTSWDYGDSSYDTAYGGLDTNFGGGLDWDGNTGSSWDTSWDTSSWDTSWDTSGWDYSYDDYSYDDYSYDDYSYDYSGWYV